MDKALSEFNEEMNLPVGRDQIIALEEAIKDQCELIDMEQHTTNHFADGIYLRELFIPAGVVCTGKIHKTRHITIVASGTCRITTDDGVKEITGPAVFVSEPGIKKAVVALTDVVIMNPHATESTDLLEIENQFVAPTLEALEKENKLWLG